MFKHKRQKNKFGMFICLIPLFWFWRIRRIVVTLDRHPAVVTVAERTLKFFLNISKVIYSFIIPVHLKFPDLLDLMDLAF